MTFRWIRVSLFEFPEATEKAVNVSHIRPSIIARFISIRRQKCCTYPPPLLYLRLSNKRAAPIHSTSELVLVASIVATLSMTMPRTRRIIHLSRARALLARLSHRHKCTPPKTHDTPQATPPSIPSTPTKLSHHKLDDRCTPSTIRAPRRLMPRPRCSRTRSDMHMDNQAMQTRLVELEMIEMENSSLRLQVDDLQRALDGVTQEKDSSQVGELEMATIENSSLLLQLECLRNEFRRPCYGAVDVVETRLAWLNVDAV